MPAPKKPQDHKPKAEKATAKTDAQPVKEVEFHGHTYGVDMRGADDVDIMDAMADAKTSGDDGDYMAVFSLMLRGILGEEYRRWKAEQRIAHAGHKDGDEPYEGDCECGGRLGAYVMQRFIAEAGQGNS